MTNRTANFIFDVEGTLVDCVPQVLSCWVEVLAHRGFGISRNLLAEYSGMDPVDMLAQLLPEVGEAERKSLIAEQGDEYRRGFLPSTTAFPDVRELLAEVKRHGFGVALATTCDSVELSHYRKLMKADDLIDAIACGDDVARGKPHPDLFELALTRLDDASAWAIGDTPYDAAAAQRAGIKAIGMLTGGFSASHLLEAGCKAVFASPSELLKALQTRSMATWAA